MPFSIQESNKNKLMCNSDIEDIKMSSERSEMEPSGRSPRRAKSLLAIWQQQVNHHEACCRFDISFEYARRITCDHVHSLIQNTSVPEHLARNQQDQTRPSILTHILHYSHREVVSHSYPPLPGRTIAPRCPEPSPPKLYS